MMNGQTVASRFPEGVSRLKRAGFHSVAELAAKSPTYSKMAETLGYHPTTVHNWLNIFNRPEGKAEVAARDALAAMPKLDGDGAQIAAPTETVTEAITDDGDVYSLARISEKKREKLLRLLEVLGAEVEEL